MMKAVPIASHRHRATVTNLLWPLLALLVAITLNYGLNENHLVHYDWLLRPVVWLLEWTQGVIYTITPSGYQLPGSPILVAPSCAGLRFLGLALIGGACLLQGQRWPTRLQNFMLLIPAVYLLTILASFARILVWMRLQNLFESGAHLATIPDGFLPAGDPHALTGFIIYIIFFIIAGALWPRIQKERN